MLPEETGVEMRCSACSWERIYTSEEIRVWGARNEEQKVPNRQTVRELLAGLRTEELECPECHAPGLVIRPCELASEDDWQQAITCEQCRRPIPLERLEAVPGTKRCAACQRQAEQPTSSRELEPEFCPRCGSPLVLRMRRGSGVTQYKLFCTGVPPCRLS